MSEEKDEFLSAWIRNIEIKSKFIESLRWFNTSFKSPQGF